MKVIMIFIGLFSIGASIANTALLVRYGIFTRLKSRVLQSNRAGLMQHSIGWSVIAIAAFLVAFKIMSIPVILGMVVGISFIHAFTFAVVDVFKIRIT